MYKPNWIDFEKDKMNGKDYFKDMEQEFPNLVEELSWHDDELIHLKMEVFSDYTNQQILRGNDNELIRCFRFQEQRIEKINSELENAIYVSYCETLFTENSKSVMKEKKKLMSEKLKRCYEEYEKTYAKLFKK